MLTKLKMTTGHFMFRFTYTDQLCEVVHKEGKAQVGEDVSVHARLFIWEKIEDPVFDQVFHQIREALSLGD